MSDSTSGSQPIDNPEGDRPLMDDNTPWDDRIEFRTDSSGRPYAYVHEVVVLIPDDATDARLRGVAETRLGPGRYNRRAGAGYGRVRPIGDADREAEVLNSLGFVAQPTHAVFATPVGVHANPATFGSPAGFAMLFGCDCHHLPAPCTFPRRARAPRKSLAEPADPLDEPSSLGKKLTCEVVVLDTGMALSDYLPNGFVGARPVTVPADTDRPDEAQDQILDPVAGHGTFIAGLIRRLAPEAHVRVVRVLSSFGVGEDTSIGDKIAELAGSKPAIQILSLSFCSYTKDDKPPIAMTDEIAKFVAGGGVVVASAGNDGTCRTSYPAGLDEVVSVGALGPDGPAWFTNYGSWVRASAPGQDVVSRFFDPRVEKAPDHESIKQFRHGWASWSGTSFSAPIVAAVIARAVCRENLSPHDAVKRHIDDPVLMRLPGLGTIINEHAGGIQPTPPQ